MGALGIPLDLLQRLNMQFYEFHDTKLSTIVENACHASIESTTMLACGRPK